MSDQRPGSRARAPDELVEELDREQQSDGAGEAPGSGLTGRPGGAHPLEPYRGAAAPDDRPS